MELIVELLTRLILGRQADKRVPTGLAFAIVLLLAAAVSLTVYFLVW